MATQYEIVQGVAEKFGSRLAIISEEDGSRTYSELVSAAAQLAFALRSELGLEFGDKVALWGWNRPEWVDAFLACSAAGLTCYPLNPDWTAGETAAVLNQVGAQVLIHDAALGPRAGAVRARAPHLHHVISIGESGGLTLKHLQSLAPIDCESRLPKVPESAGLPYFFTSGTTGSRSKAVVKSSAAASARAAFRLDEIFNLDESDRVLITTPLFHGNGNSGAMFTLGFGGSVVFPRRFSARRFWPLVDRYRPTFFFTLMPILNILMSLKPTAVEKSNSLKYVLALGIAPYASAVEERYGVRAIDWYGSTEIGGAVCTPLDEPNRPGATGKVLPGVQMSVLREDMTLCEPGETGQVAFDRRLIGFAEYADDPTATADVIHGDYFLTGDLGYFDADGWFFFVDRLKDIVRRGGENISSLEVEAVLATHPAVGEIAVVPRPDPILGERVTAFVVPKEGVAAPDPRAFRSFAGKQLAGFKIPDLVIEVAELPRTENGKIKKAALKARLKDSPGL